MVRGKRRNTANSLNKAPKRARKSTNEELQCNETSEEVYNGVCSVLSGRLQILHSIGRQWGVPAAKCTAQVNSNSESRESGRAQYASTDEDEEARLESIMSAQHKEAARNKSAAEKNDSDAEKRPRFDYLLAANPKGKARTVGAPKRNRKEQMSVHDQIRAGQDLARALGVVRCGDAPSAAEESADHADGSDAGQTSENDTTPPPPPSDTCVDGNSSSDAATRCSARAGANHAAQAKKYSFLRSFRADEQARKKVFTNTDAYVPLRVNARDENEETESQQKSDSAESVVQTTSSDQLQPHDYSVYDKTQTYEDEAFDEFASDAAALSDSAVREYAERLANASTLTASERLDLARAAFDRCGYGRAAVTMEDFDVTRAAALAKHDCRDGKARHVRANSACCYPTTSNLRCRYDHHRFNGIPILLPLHYHAEKNILEVLPDAVFCSFACAMAYVQRDAPRLHHDVRNDRVALLRFMARKWFGISERVRPAPMLQQQREYGGRLSIEQFRALSHTHHSFVEYPLAAAVPARYVTEIVVSRRMDRAKRQGLRLRVAEQHGNQVPEAPAALDIDPTAPAAPRGAEARARAARAKEARVKKLGAKGIQLPDKKRTVTTENGEQQTIDRSYVDQVIRRTAEQQKGKPKRRHALQHMLSVKKVSPAKK